MLLHVFNLNRPRHLQDNRTTFPLNYWEEGWFDDVASYAEALSQS